VIVSGTIETMGTMLAGQTADALYSSIAQADLLAVGLNCGTGPEFMTDHLRTLSEMAAPRASPAIRMPACRTWKASTTRRRSLSPSSWSGSWSTAG
jgi:methionine synthase I (cobalamin-dependent)